MKFGIDSFSIVMITWSQSEKLDVWGRAKVWSCFSNQDKHTASVSKVNHLQTRGCYLIWEDAMIDTENRCSKPDSVGQDGWQMLQQPGRAQRTRDLPPINAPPLVIACKQHSGASFPVTMGKHGYSLLLIWNYYPVIPLLLARCDSCNNTLWRIWNGPYSGY